MMDWLATLFREENGQASMSRLLLFLSFFVGTYLMIIDTHRNGLSEGNFTIYLAAFAGSYIGGKFAEVKRMNKGDKDDLDEYRSMDRRPKIILPDDGGDHVDGADAGGRGSNVSGRGL